MVNFADIVKFATKFIETTFKDLKKVKKKKLCIKMQSISVFLDITKVTDFRLKNTDVSRTQVVRHVVYTFFESSLGKG